MKRVKIANIFLCIASAFLFLSLGCGKDLTRDKAFILISKNLPNPITVRIRYGENIKIGLHGAEDSAIWHKLQEIEIIKASSLKRGYEWEALYSDIAIHEKIKKFVIGDLKDEYNNRYKTFAIGNIKLVEITGIKQIPENKVAESEFTWRINDLSELGKVTMGMKFNSLIRKNDNIPIDNKIHTGKAFLTLYDDGWRIMRIEIANQVYEPK